MLENANHLIYECSRSTKEREQLIESIEAKGGQWPCDENVLISNDYFEYFIIFCENTLKLE
jgi:hypothetical protein